MMLKKYIKNLTVFLISSLLVSCSGNEEKKENNALAYTYVTIERAHPTCKDENPDNGCMKISFSFPRFTEKTSIPVKDSLRNAFASFLFGNPNKPIEKESFRELTQEMFALYDSTLSNLSNYNLPWKLRQRIRLIHQTPKYLSAEFEEQEFTGGAHGNELKMYRSYSIPDGHRITLAEIVGQNNTDRLTAMAESLFTEQKQLPDNPSYEDDGYFFKNGKFSLNNNYALTDNGLLFYYNAYEIAPFSEGPTRLLLTYERIDSLLTDPYKPSSVFNNEEVN